MPRCDRLGEEGADADHRHAGNDRNEARQEQEAQASKRLELAKTSFEAAVQNMRELAEVAGRSNREALEVINQRALESFEEIKRAMDRKR